MSTSHLRRVAVLGSTGSIGCNTLAVIARLPERFAVVALAAGRNADRMAEQVERFHPRLVAMATPDDAAVLRQKLQQRAVAVPEIVSGSQGLLSTVTASGAELVVAATVGVTALEAIHAALRAGLDLALANKEALVVAGELLLQAAHSSGASLLPIDSEHSAIHQCLRGGERGEIKRLVLTASGGPLLRHSPAEMEKVVPAEALRHPVWSMGRRISLDSATLMNKGFEVIEACHLFGIGESQVEVLVHRQSVVHSMVEFTDGSVLAQLGTADMRIPIQYALTYPERLTCPGKRLKLEEVGRLDFELPDLERFPCLRLAREAHRTGGGSPAVLNAADEVAGAAFLAGRIGFSAIARVVEQSLEAWGGAPAASLEAVLEADREGRRIATSLVGQG